MLLDIEEQDCMFHDLTTHESSQRIVAKHTLCGWLPPEGHGDQQGDKWANKL